VYEYCTIRKTILNFNNSELLYLRKRRYTVNRIMENIPYRKKNPQRSNYKLQYNYQQRTADGGAFFENKTRNSCQKTKKVKKLFKKKK
jgi:hypothetical protein